MGDFVKAFEEFLLLLEEDGFIHPYKGGKAENKPYEIQVAGNRGSVLVNITFKEAQG